jgi:hypothetical protein
MASERRAEACMLGLQTACWAYRLPEAALCLPRTAPDCFKY